MFVEGVRTGVRIVASMHLGVLPFWLREVST